MPEPDPLPPPPPIKAQFLRIMRWGALFSLAIAALAVVLVATGDTELHIHMLIATALGVGLSVLLGIALMSLAFISSRAHDAEASHHKPKDDHEPRP